jgi:hypothetical protein
MSPTLRVRLLTLGILAVAAILRFWNLSERGLVEWDGAHYVGVAKTWGAGLTWLWDRYVLNEAVPSLSERLLTDGVASSTTAKEGFISVLLLGAPFVGFSELLGPAVAACAGVMTIWVCGQVGAAAFNPAVGLLAMFLLTFSFIHLHYSRSGFPMSVATLCLTAAWLLYLRSRNVAQPRAWRHRKVLACGAMTGMAFTVHYNLFWVPPVFVGLFAWELPQGWLRRATSDQSYVVRDAVVKLGLFSIGLLLPLLIFEGGTSIIKSAVEGSSSLSTAVRGRYDDATFLTYFEALRYQIFGAAQEDVSLLSAADPLFYVRLIGRWEGYVALVFLFVSLLWIALRRDLPVPVRISCLAFGALPLAIWSAFSFPVARTIAAATPAWAVVIAASVDEAYRRLQPRIGAHVRLWTACLLVTVAAAGVWRARPIWDVRSGMGAAVEFMRQQGSIKHASTEFPLSRLVVGRQNAIDTTVTFSKSDAAQVLNSLYADGYRFVLASGPSIMADAHLRALLTQARPIFRTHHSTHLHAYEYFSRDAQRAVLDAPEQIEVYAIRDVLDAVRLNRSR